MSNVSHEKTCEVHVSSLHTLAKTRNLDFCPNRQTPYKMKMVKSRFLVGPSLQTNKHPTTKWRVFKSKSYFGLQKNTYGSGTGDEGRLTSPQGREVVPRLGSGSLGRSGPRPAAHSGVPGLGEGGPSGPRPKVFDAWVATSMS